MHVARRIGLVAAPRGRLLSRAMPSRLMQTAVTRAAWLTPLGRNAHVAKMQLRMCASSASAPLADASATQGREVREEGGAQGNWASEEGLKHSKKVAARIYEAYGLSSSPPLQRAEALNFLLEKGMPEDVAKKLAPASGDMTLEAFTERAIKLWGATTGAAGLPEYLGLSVTEHKKRNFLGYWSMDTLYPLGAWKYITYHQFELYAADVRRLLAEEGAVRGTRIATISRNSSEFAAVAFATWGLGAVHVPIPENMTTEDMELIIGGSESEIVLCENKEILDKVVAARERLPRVKSVLLFDGFDGSSWDDASFTNKLKQTRGKIPIKDPLPVIRGQLDQVASIIYSPGTLAPPHPVTFTHGELIAGALQSRLAVGLRRQDVTLSFISWSIPHVFTSELLGGMAAGCRINYCDGMYSILRNLEQVRATVLFCGGTMINELWPQAKHVNGVHPVEVWLLKRAITAAAAVRRGDSTPQQRVENAVLQIGVLWRLKKAMGKRLERVFTDTISPVKLASDLVLSVSPEVRTLYGVPEACGLLASTRPSLKKAEKARGGGMAISPGVVLDGDLSNEGGVCDIVSSSASGGGTKGLKLAVRLKGAEGRDFQPLGKDAEKIQVSLGAIAWPALMEQRLRTCDTIIHQAAVYPGSGGGEVQCFIVPNFEELYLWQVERFGHKRKQSNDQMLADKAVQQLVRDRLRGAAAAALASDEFASAKVTKVDYTMLADEFTVDSGTLAHDMSLRREVIWDKYGREMGVGDAVGQMEK